MLPNGPVKKGHRHNNNDWADRHSRTNPRNSGTMSPCLSRNLRRG